VQNRSLRSLFAQWAAVPAVGSAARGVYPDANRDSRHRTTAAYPKCLSKNKFFSSHFGYAAAHWAK